MGKREQRSAASPQGKNCGMGPKMSGFWHAIVHTCLSACAKVGGLCMAAWRRTTSAFARKRMSAKRTLTNIEGVLITLALIATLGIASPLAAGAMETVEDPAPVTGALGADGEQIGDVADSNEALDEAGAVDSNETAKDDAAGDQGATKGDVSDGMTEAADADANASERDASTDGDEDVKAETATNGIDEPKKAARAYTYDDIPKRYKDDRSDIFVADGGRYNPLGYILSNYNVFVEGDLGSDSKKNGHIVGPVFVGQNFYNAGSIGLDNQYTHKVSSYIGGIWGYPIASVFTGENQLKLYLNWKNYRGVTSGNFNGQPVNDVLIGIPALNNHSGTLEDYYRNKFVRDDQYVADKAAMFQDIRNQASTIASSGVTVNENDNSSNDYQTENGSLILTAGKEYKISSVLLGKYNNNIILKTNATIEDASKLPETTIRIDGAGTQFLPSISKYRVNGEDKAFSEAQFSSGLPLVLVYPSATEVTGSSETIYGHVVAPNAYVHHTASYNGCVIAKSANLISEGHMWPYNGTRLIPDAFYIQAQKSLIGRQLKDQEFTFEVYKAKNSWHPDGIEWEKNGFVQRKKNDINGNVNFDPIGITEQDVLAGGASIDWTSFCTPDQTTQRCSITKNFGYIVEEQIPNSKDPLITYDQTKFHVTVPATITFDYSEPTRKPDITIVAGAPTYSLGSGNIDDHLQGGKPHFINVADSTRLKIQKEIEEYDESKDSTVTFSFQVSLELPDGMSLKAADSSTAQPQTLFFDNMTDPKNPTTYGYACVANDTKNGCKRSGESNVASRQEFYIPEGTTIMLPDDYAQQFRVEIEPIENTTRSRIKLIAKDTSNPPVVPSEISWPQLVVGSPSSTYVQCPSNPNKTCTQITLNVTGQSFAELEKLPLGTKYTITEQPSDGFSLVGFNNGTEQSASGELTGTDSSGNKIEYITVTAKNKRTPKPVSLVIMKRVVDADNQEVTEGLPDDAVFTIEINLYKEGYQNNRVPGGFDYTKTGGGQANETGKLNCTSEGCDQITLKPRQTITITGLPDGTRFNVEETDAGGFEHVSTVVSQPATCASTFAASQTACQLSNGAQGEVTVTNRYVTVVLPETGGNAHPIMTMLFGMGVVCAGLLITAIYMRRQGMAMLQ